MENIKDKVLGCMLGGAIGDALGYAVEFISYSQIISRYGHEGITRFEPDNRGLAIISDDTQMSLYTANGLLVDDIAGAYLEWLDTQEYAWPTDHPHKCWLSDIPALYARRAPGTTCMSALHTLSQGHEVTNNSKGCGGIMRVAPIAIWGATHQVPISESVKRAFDAAALTHKHVHGWLPSGMLVYVIQRIIEEAIDTREALLSIVDEGLRFMMQCQTPATAHHFRSFEEDTRRAISLAAKNRADESAIRSLGEGWTGEEAWYIAIYCSLKHFDSFEKAVVAAVNHNGDSDSTGAICGNIMGAIHGRRAIPDHYLANLELRDIIERISTQLL